MTAFHRITLAQKAFRELGAAQVWQYTIYQVKLRTGWLRWITRDASREENSTAYRFTQSSLFPIPTREALHHLLGRAGLERLTQQADEIVSGKVSLFGNDPRPLALVPAPPLQHWTAYAKRGATLQDDPREIWEHARFGWAFSLARAYYLTGEERFADSFWQYTERFLAANPPYQGPNWISAQEAGLRLVAFTILIPILSPSAHSTPERLSRLSHAIADHAKRIPPSLAYARAQNNNHLLSEAAGLFTAGVALPQHPEAKHWRQTGWEWFNRALLSQIAADGSYIQNSTNYHRLALQLALWVSALAADQGLTYSETVQQRLRSASRWLSRLLDPDSGRVPNLGPNDGAFIIPLVNSPVDDYRPVIQAASKAFLNSPALEPGIWDELSLWLCSGRGIENAYLPESPRSEKSQIDQPLRLENQCSASWVYFRVAEFKDRPGHADQLHVDLWWRGLNLAQDAGTYRYNDSPPWDNALSGSTVHNTVTLEGRDQMTRAGRFLWLDWAQARLIKHTIEQDISCESWVAEHNGYRHEGVLHQRSVTSCRHGGWMIEDKLVRMRSTEADSGPVSMRLHWLLPDWGWQIEPLDQGACLHLASPLGRVRLQVIHHRQSAALSGLDLTLCRAGELLSGIGPVLPVWGWASLNYAHKIPALSFAVRVQDSLPITLTSEWTLPNNITQESP